MMFDLWQRLLYKFTVYNEIFGVHRQRWIDILTVEEMYMYIYNVAEITW